MRGEVDTYAALVSTNDAVKYFRGPYNQCGTVVVELLVFVHLVGRENERCAFFRLGLKNVHVARTPPFEDHRVVVLSSVHILRSLHMRHGVLNGSGR